MTRIIEYTALTVIGCFVGWAVGGISGLIIAAILVLLALLYDYIISKLRK